jgi:DNA primase large subunit
VVKLINFSLEQPDPIVIERAKQRVVDGIEGDIVRPEADSRNDKILIREVLSFPLAKILVALTNDSFIRRRYARAEANSLKRFLDREPGIAPQLAADLGAPIEGGTVPFTAYANASPSSEALKLVNSRLLGGRVTLRSEALTGFVSELFRQKVERDVSVAVDVPARYASIAAEIKKEVNREKAYESGHEAITGPADPSIFPPCIKALVDAAQSGQPMAHQPRFTLATFLINANSPLETIVDVFRTTPNFDERKTRYYVEYSMGKRGSGVKYSAPSCEKMKFYGICVNPDALCQRVRHPLSYYSAKSRERKAP